MSTKRSSRRHRSPRPTKIHFFTDQNVPDAVGNFLMDAGHQVTRLRYVMESDSPDQIVAITCAQNNLVLITHDKDFRQGRDVLKITKRQYQNTLHRILMQCVEPEDRKRIEAALPLIEFEWANRLESQQLLIELRETSILTRR